MANPAYDDNGNLTDDGSTYKFEYDAENRLTKSKTSGGSTIGTYTFDGRGRRTSKTVSGTTTVYVTDADNREVLEYDDATGAIQRWYPYGLGPNAVLGQMNVAAGTRSTPVPDLLGSIIGTMDASSGTLTSFAYRPYGAATSSPTAFGYTGQRIDNESGLDHYRARHYSPAWGRFLQVDPLGYRAGLNVYTYVGNDPLNFVDPAGEIGGCSGSACSAIPAALALVQSAAAAAQPGSAAQARLQSAATFLAGPTASVVFTNMSGGYAGGASANPSNGSVAITIDQASITRNGAIDSSGLAGILVHEGAGHGADLLALGISAPTTLRQERQLEYSAYSLEQTFYQTLNLTSFSGVWQQGWSPLMNQSDAARALADAIQRSVDVWTGQWQARGTVPPPIVGSSGDGK